MIGCGTVAALLSLSAPGAGAAANDLSIPEILAKVGPSIARVINPVSVGTAFVFDQAGHLLTNCHVVSDEKGVVFPTVQVELVARGIAPVDAKVLGCDKFSDLAALEVDKVQALLLGHPPPIPPASFADLRVGDAVMAVGFALDIKGEPSVTRGIISGLHRNLAGQFSDLIQTDASVNHGNSGGPLLNMQGQFVGVNTFTSDIVIPAGTDLSDIKKRPLSLPTSHGVFHARSVGTALPFANELVAAGRVRRADIGLGNIATASDDEARDLLKLPKGGVLILSFSAGSRLQTAGLHEGDVIVGAFTCSGPGDPITACGTAAATIDNVGTLRNVLAFAASGKEMIVQAMRPPACAFEALENGNAPPDSCQPGRDVLQQVRIPL